MEEGLIWVYPLRICQHGRGGIGARVALGCGSGVVSILLMCRHIRKHNFPGFLKEK